MKSGEETAEKRRLAAERKPECRMLEKDALTGR